MNWRSVKPQLDIDEADVWGAIRQAYGLPVERITFSTTGWISYCYKVETVAGERYLLKLYDESAPAPLLASSRDFYLPLTYQLCTRHLLPQIACPVQALDGSFTIRTGCYLLILFHYIEGKPVGFGRLPDEILVKLAGLVGQLHRSTRSIELANPLIERFEIAFEDALPKWLEALASLEPGARAGLRAYRELLVPHKDEIRGYLDRLKGLQSVMRSRAREMVMCHTDLHGGNLLVDRAGNLYILDWEGAMLAPPEQDLFFFAGEDRFWDLFWPNYSREFGPARLDVDVLAFYYYRRGLEDVAEFTKSILYTDQDDEKDRETIHWTGACLKDLSNVEAAVVKISAHLAHR
jgi:spectinomycin phosphotransferase